MAVLNIEGLGPVQTINNEYTSSLVANTYKTLIATAKSVFDNGTQAYTSAEAEQDFLELVLAVQGLRDLALNGLSGDPLNPTQDFFITSEMAGSLDLVMKSLRSAGIDIPELPDQASLDAYINSFSNDQKRDLIKSWNNLAGFGVQEILTKATSITNRSLQSMIELEYVKVGNEVIFDSLTDLEEALRGTKQILETLNQMQSLKNLVDLDSDIRILNNGFSFDVGFGAKSFRTSNFLMKFPGDPGGFFLFTDTFGVDASGNPVPLDSAQLEAWFRWGASIYFNQIFPSATAGADDGIALLLAKAQLYDQISLLEKVSPENNRNTPGTLANNLLKLAENISTIFVDINGVPLDPTSSGTDLTNAVKAWIIDGRRALGLSDESGASQRILTNAIIAAESLNDTQKQDVRRYMFVFEEFYKSASSILIKITQIIEKMAQGIAR